MTSPARPRRHTPLVPAAVFSVACLLVTALLPRPLPLRAEVIGSPGDGGVITVRPDAAIRSRQGLKQYVGISGANSGARGLSMNRVVIPPGGQAAAHRHVGYESTVYLLQGTVETRYGPRLEKSVLNRAGDFLFIPAGVLHQPVNLSRTEPAIAIVARNDPNEQESVELHDATGLSGR
jgi:uncharacterized RmlC-like cupin family protein